MATQATASTTSCQSCEPCYASGPARQSQQIEPKKPSKCEEIGKKVMAVFEKLCLLALSAYAAYLSLDWFLCFAGGGFVLGFAWQYYKLSNGQSAFKNCQAGSGCSQDLMAQLTRVPLPQPLGLIAAVAMAAEHLRHHRMVTVPIVGFNFGTMIGAVVATGVHGLLNRKAIAANVGKESSRVTPLQLAAAAA